MDKKKLYDYCMNSPENCNPAVIASIVGNGGSGENNIITLNCTNTGEIVIRHDYEYRVYTLPVGYAFGEPTRGNTNTIFLRPIVEKNTPIYILNFNLTVNVKNIGPQTVNFYGYPIGSDYDLYYYDGAIFTGWVGTAVFNNKGELWGVAYLDDRTKFLTFAI